MIRGRWTIFALSLATSGCAALPLSYLDSRAPVGGELAQLGWGLLIISILVIVIIAALLIGAIQRGTRVSDDAQLAVRRDSGGMQWIYVGVGISSVVLAASVIWTLLTLKAVAQPADQVAPLTIGINAHQWWWEADYRPHDSEGNFSTANEIHIPVGVPVRLELRSADVIHSFWVPKLTGKTDVIPGRVNSMWIESNAPGIYRGQCAEYCGVEHALMGFRVVAEPVANFRAWQTRQIQGPALAAARPGYALFAAHCGACHDVRGTSSGGVYGPDLTNLAERRTLAAGVLQNNPQNLAYWIHHAQEVKPGSQMPDIPLSDDETRQIVRYLEAR
jgi:cytochrome c oxidase subunit 2